MTRNRLSAHAKLALAATAVTLLGTSAVMAKPGTARHRTARPAAHAPQATQGQAQNGQVPSPRAATTPNGKLAPKPKQYVPTLQDILISSVKSEVSIETAD